VISYLDYIKNNLLTILAMIVLTISENGASILSTILNGTLKATRLLFKEVHIYHMLKKILIIL
jgi:hypothetical protein